MIQSPSQTIFYTIERAIKEYRRLSQKRLKAKYRNITIDQAMVLFFIDQRPNITQNEIASLVFKDNASLTRMIELMHRNGFLNRSVDLMDRRRYILEITPKGKKTLGELIEIIKKNRQHALENVDRDELDQLQRTLNKIIANCVKGKALLKELNSV